MKKVMLIVFNGEEMCFIHVLLNGLDMKEKAFDVGIIMEGASTKLVPHLEKEGHFLHPLWKKARQEGLLEGVCRACCSKMGTLKAAEEAGLPIIGDMSGHPSISRYMEQGFTIITF